MKYLLIILVLTATSARAQTLLNFNKTSVECEDRWVAYEMDKDSSYAYGFIYIDAQAGLTLNYEGKFKIATNGVFIPKKLDSTSLKVRLEQNRVKLAFIPESKFTELKITAVPDWLRFYKTDTASVQRLYRWGFLYNGWDMCAKALTYLERAQKIDPKFKGLQVELAFSYNCLHQFDKAIDALNGVLEIDPTNAYVWKELVYAQAESGQLDDAAKNCTKALSVCTDKEYNGEMCYNLLHQFYVKKDKVNFNLWLAVTKKWGSTNANIAKSVKAMEEEINK